MKPLPVVIAGIVLLGIVVMTVRYVGLGGPMIGNTNLPPSQTSGVNSAPSAREPPDPNVTSGSPY